MEWCIEWPPRSGEESPPQERGVQHALESGQGRKWQPEDFPHYGQQADGSTNPLVGQDRPQRARKEIGATAQRTVPGPRRGDDDELLDVSPVSRMSGSD